MEKKIILEENDFTAIVAYLRSVPVAFDRIEAAAAVKAAVGRAMLADIQFENKPGNVGFPGDIPKVKSPVRTESGDAGVKKGTKPIKNV